MASSFNVCTRKKRPDITEYFIWHTTTILKTYASFKKLLVFMLGKYVIFCEQLAKTQRKFTRDVQKLNENFPKNSIFSVKLRCVVT